ncbi:universal stress protein [Rhabdaerophilum sp. SD176]|uniref:universal stress protein n=1 Tax=Rhabdaerophilum sp. SD176 TaxID=2983548 RepID=UPI0024E026AD|nr:universal stress protein [Rhabdaerophilum sp. SD176]
MPIRRRAYEPGHRPKILIVIDETPECDRAALFAARRARRSGASIIMLAIVIPEEGQPWLGVGDLMRAEAEAEAGQRLDKAAELVRREAGFEPERVIRTGQPAQEVMGLIEADEDIAILVLAAGIGKEGPGPLVSHIAGRVAANFPVPVTIVPGGLAEADFEALA